VRAIHAPRYVGLSVEHGDESAMNLLGETRHADFIHLTA
jgi:hypothetical protein